MIEDPGLVDRAASGDTEALARLAMLHRPTVLRIARHMLGDESAADDVAQDVFIRLQSALPGFRGDAALSTWIYRVTLNLCHDHTRRQRRRRNDLELDAAAHAPAMAVAPLADRRLDAERVRNTVRAAVARLPTEQREAVTLRFLEDLSYTEIARLTGTPMGTVASRVFRALERLGLDLEIRTLEVVK